MSSISSPFSENRKPEQASDVEQAVLKALGTIQDADTQKSIVDEGMIANLKVEDGLASYEINLTAAAAPHKNDIQDACVQVTKSVEGVKYVSTKLNAPPVQAHSHQKAPIEGVKHIIAVSSGKGGVGKTTTSVNLACALQQQGYQVGLLDADIYGPNVPLMMGLVGAVIKEKTDNGKMKPPENHGVKVMSMAFLLKPGQPVIWRGPLLDRVIRQFFNDTGWAPLDYLIVDLPPGTGDAQLTLMEAIPLAGAIIVTTPQDVALLDSQKGLAMFLNNQTPVIGVVENMSYYLVPGTGEPMYLFGQGGGKTLAEQVNVPLLGEIPINPDIRVNADAGQPIVVSDPGCPEAEAFKLIAKKVVEAVTAQHAEPATV